MHVKTTAPVEVNGQAARSQLVKNTGLMPCGQTNSTKRTIIHTIHKLVGTDTLWTTKVLDSPLQRQSRRNPPDVPVTTGA
jgi:hypothetical protein